MSSNVIFPFKPGDWVMNQSGRVARVKAVDCYQGEITFDLVIYSRDGDKIGRESPAMGGPRTFEPSCSTDGWERCVEPDFPLEPKWIKQPDGSMRAMYWAERLPPARYRKRQRRATGSLFRLSRDLENTRFRRALENIARGDNSPRETASIALGWKAAE